MAKHAKGGDAGSDDAPPPVGKQQQQQESADVQATPQQEVPASDEAASSKHEQPPMAPVDERASWVAKIVQNNAEIERIKAAMAKHAKAKQGRGKRRCRNRA